MNQPEKFVEVGTAELFHATTFRNSSYQTASWWHETTCQPQKATLRYYPNRTYAQFAWTFRGIRVDEHFVNRIFNYTSIVEKKLGYQEGFGFTVDAYILADRICGDRDRRFGYSRDGIDVMITDPKFVLTTRPSSIGQSSSITYGESK